ncbi:MAG: RNA 2',3'-cyclic phosphodiesterase [Dehalococcoidia bacterium]|nr:MAG: RNA 2',3'-cyclic phosphodiesterase [Dehalococcoidia bacterium]
MKENAADLGPVRAFVALPLPATIRAHLTNVQQAIARHSGRAVKWAGEEAMHLTLEFLGDVPRWVLVDLPPALEHAVAGAPSLQLETAGVGAFPNWRTPKVIWLGVEGDLRGLRLLRERVAGALRQFGFAADPRPFRPHLTLGRVRPHAEPALLERLVATAPNVRPDRQVFTADRVVLYRSILAPSGPTHLVLAEWLLG